MNVESHNDSCRYPIREIASVAVGIAVVRDHQSQQKSVILMYKIWNKTTTNDDEHFRAARLNSRHVYVCIYIYTTSLYEHIKFCIKISSCMYMCSHVCSYLCCVLVHVYTPFNERTCIENPFQEDFRFLHCLFNLLLPAIDGALGPKALDCLYLVSR